MRSQHVTLPYLGVFSPISEGHLTPNSPWETKQITNIWRFHSSHKVMQFYKQG